VIDEEKEIGKGDKNRRGWWEECRYKKKELRKKLRKWRKRGRKEI